MRNGSRSCRRLSRTPLRPGRCGLVTSWRAGWWRRCSLIWLLRRRRTTLCSRGFMSARTWAGSGWTGRLCVTCSCGRTNSRPVVSAAIRERTADGRRTSVVAAKLVPAVTRVASEWTRHQAWTVLQSALSAAVREELLTRNVASLVRVPVPRPKRAKAWTAEQSRRFLESARTDDDPLYGACILMLVLGLRRGDYSASPGTMLIWSRRRRGSAGSCSGSTAVSSGGRPRRMPRMRRYPCRTSASGPQSIAGRSRRGTARPRRPGMGRGWC